MYFSKIFNRLGIVSLQDRLRTIFICFIAAMVIIAAVPFIYYGQKHNRENANVTIEKAIQLQQLIINNWFENRMANILALSSMPGVHDIDLKSMTVALREFDKSNHEFDGVFFVNEVGISEVNTLGNNVLDVSDRDYFKAAQNGRAFITDALIGRQSGNHVVIISNPIFDDAGVFKGVILGSVTLTTINNILKQFYDDSSQAYIVNQKGMVITDSSQGKVGEFIDTEIFRSSLEGRTVNGFYTRTDGKEVLGKSRWVHNNQWLIIAEIEKSKVYESFYKTSIMFSIIILFGTFIGYVLLKTISVQISNPIRRVLKAARNVRDHNFNYRLNAKSFEKDAIEFQVLCENFNDMNEIIENYIEKLEENEERFRMITEYSSDLITIHDSTGKYLYVSAAGKDILNYDNDEMIGKPGNYYIHPDDIAMTDKHFEKLLREGYVVVTFRIRRKDGEYIWFESSLKSLAGKDDEEQFICISRNITKRREAELKLEEANKVLKELSEKDGLTGIWNRRSFDEQLKNEWLRSLINGEHLSLIMLDIDEFKKYNDTKGHQAGDDCLRQIAQVIDATVSETDNLAFRYGGEEFAILLPGANATQAVHVAEWIQNAVARLALPHPTSAVSNVVTISLGVRSIVPDEKYSIAKFMADADDALYKAKQQGRNRYWLFEQ